MKIALFEFDYHGMLITTFCKMFETSEHSVTVFTTTKIYNEIKDQNDSSKVSYVIKGDENLKIFMDKNISFINSHNLIFFNTIASNYKTIYNTNFTIPTIFRIHNANTYLKPFQNLYVPKNLFELFKYISYVVREMITTLDFYYIKKLIKKFDYICLNDLYREEYVIKNKMIINDKIFPCIPFAISDSLSKECNPLKNTLTITIPGSIDKRRRDYNIIVSTIKELTTQLNSPIELYLLGKPIGEYGNTIIAQLKDIEGEKFKLTSFNEYISQNKFDRIIAETDIILSPLIIENQFRIFKEVYGKSKSSGSVYDLITYGKLTIFPASFYNDKEMNKYVDYYTSSHSLGSIILNYSNNRDELIRKSNALRNFLITNYSSTKIVNKFEQDFEERFPSK